jgi:two-component system CheB/CheR fusion protein
MGAEERERAEVCVLVIDDDRDIADTTVLVLNQFGLPSLAAHDAHNALKLAENFRPRVVLLDLAMPFMDGYHLARDLRALAGMDNAVLIAISGYGADNDRRRSRAAAASITSSSPSTGMR